jgi:SAM-dependent methyltransferase
MVVKLILPLLGGSSSVWNTSQAFFQIALLLGYGYAHALQKIRSLRTQGIVHCVALIAAALALPLRVNDLVGPPSSQHPNLWLLAVLAASIGAPFAALSATAPLIQAWYARTVGAATGREPYALYAASNLGSLLALLAYPVLIEPTLSLAGQRYGWSIGYGLFALLLAALAYNASRGYATSLTSATPATPSPSWRRRLAWVALAAIPSSLMLGVTTYITTDVASAPFLWVLPLALYLGTFVIAFQERSGIRPEVTLVLQAAALAICVATLPFRTNVFAAQLVLHLATFFLTALMCHQRLVGLRPPPEHLTAFYLCLSIGGVVGGAFNAFVAPVVFNDVIEYPLVLALACLARPWGDLRSVPIKTGVMFALGLLASLGAVVAVALVAPNLTAASVVGAFNQAELFNMAMSGLLGLGVLAAFAVRGRALLMFALIAALSYAAVSVQDRTDTRRTWRSFFGVLKISETQSPEAGSNVRMLSHGTTLHGAQAIGGPYRCQPLVYYAPRTPIGQVFTSKRGARPNLRIGAVGLGTGSVAGYVRPADHLTFFEIDPLVVRLSNDPANFSYTTDCAKGRVDFVVGDARLTVAKQPAGAFDILLIDAFSSDAVPAHLLTVEAVRSYLAKLKPDGILILHLSNRHLELMEPAQAVAHAAGGRAMAQHFRRPDGPMSRWESSEDAVIVARNDQALAPFIASGQWRPGNPDLAQPWTDDYTNLAGAMYVKLMERLGLR